MTLKLEWRLRAILHDTFLRSAACVRGTLRGNEGTDIYCQRQKM